MHREKYPPQLQVHLHWYLQQTDVLLQLKLKVENDREHLQRPHHLLHPPYLFQGYPNNRFHLLQKHRMHAPFVLYDVLHQRCIHTLLVFYRLHPMNHPSLQMKNPIELNAGKRLDLYHGLDALPLECVAILQLQPK